MFRENSRVFFLEKKLFKQTQNSKQIMKGKTQQTNKKPKLKRWSGTFSPF